ncbi:DUF6705 family protein, partial [Flavobacterium sp. 83]|uniref:DUF6705 family protein n=1 Tax=Flavobacterium sp. 83 TaxID=1131812 RepID=UPI000557A706
MKKLVIIGYLLTIAISCKAQTIVPVEKTIDYMIAQNGIPEGTYLKDVNNLLGKYIGTWKGTFENKNYTFIVKKYTCKPQNVTYDKLLIRYLITTTNGVIIEDTRNLPDTSTYVIEGYYFSKDLTYYVSNYYGKNSGCGQKGTVYIRMKNISNTDMSLTFEPEKILLTEDSCTGLKLAEQLLPRNGMRLTKL